MNLLVKSLAIFFAGSMVFSAAIADDQPNIPASAWEQHPQEGIALAMILTTRTERDRQISSIQIYIKNTSKTDRYFQGPDLLNREIEIFYIKENNVQVPLRKYDYPSIITATVLPVKIKSGETLLRTTDLTPDEMASIKGRPVKCHVTIIVFDEAFKFNHRCEIESSPKILVAGP